MEYFFIGMVGVVKFCFEGDVFLGEGVYLGIGFVWVEVGWVFVVLESLGWEVDVGWFLDMGVFFVYLWVYCVGIMVFVWFFWGEMV